MQSAKLSITTTKLTLQTVLIVALLYISAAGQQERVLHSFNNNGKDAYGPVAGMIFDATGNLYGTTTSGGVYFAGSVFELSPKAGGGWTEKILHSFNPNAKDGNDPLGGLVMDRAGNLYGATLFGGANNTGTVFELVPKTGGGWAERILYSFNNTGTSAESPVGSLVFDAAGNLYGTTAYGGSGTGCFSGCGTVFELSPGQGGRWTEKILHSFTINGTDGSTPWAGVTLDPAGNLYGTTSAGGPGDCNAGCGVVFELTPGVGGTWTETILHSFNSDGTDGLETYVGWLSTTPAIYMELPPMAVSTIMEQCSSSHPRWAGLGLKASFTASLPMAMGPTRTMTPWFWILSAIFTAQLTRAA